MDQWAFFDEVKAGTVRNAYLFYGPEAYIRKSALTTLQKKLLTPGLEDMNCTFMQNPTAQQIVENCETLPMLGDWRLVIVQGLALLESGKAKDEAQESKTLVDYIGRVPPSTCLVFECEAPDKRKKLCQTLMKLPGAVSFDALSEARLTQWMNQTLRPMKKRMDANTCARLAFTSGRDLTMLNGELQKLAAYVGERETITAEDVEQIATHTAECTVFAMVDALVDGQAERAFSLLNVLLEGGEQRIGVLALITRQYRQMLYAKDMQESRTPQAQMAKALGVPPFALSQLTRRAGRRTMAQLKKQLALCVNADFDIKRGAVREEAALDRLMLALTEKWFGGSKQVYVCTTAFTLVAASFDLLGTLAGMVPQSSILAAVKAIGTQYIPLYSLGMGWIVPALIGFAIGMILRGAGKAKEIVLA